MSRRRQVLLIERERLLLRSGALRNRFAQQAQPFELPLTRVDQVLDGGRWLLAHPEWPAGALALWLTMRPRRILRLAALGWRTWRWWRLARPYAAPVLKAWGRR